MVLAAISGSGLLAAVGIGAAIGLVVFTLAAQADEKATVRASLRQLEGYEVEDVRDQELLKPVRERAILPVLEGLTGIGRRFTPSGYTDKVRQKYVYAGEANAEAVDKYLAIQVLSVVAGVLAGGFIFFSSGLGGLAKLLVAVLCVVVGIFAPGARLDRKVVERQQAIRNKLPDILDLLTISVEAGLGFEQALDRTVAAVPGPLSDEFGRMLGEVRAGSSRADAMRSLEARTNVAEVRSFVLAILQADTFGVSIGRVLCAQADEMRIKRRQLAEERAQKAPVKMLIPMVFCIFPALFVIVLGPAVLKILDNV